MVDRVALGQGFLRVLRFPLSTSIHHDSPYANIIWGMNNWPVGGRNFETLSLTRPELEQLRFTLYRCFRGRGRIGLYSNSVVKTFCK
jgi:hypothetical protein